MNTLSITVDIEDWYHIPSVTGSPFSVYRDVNEFFEGWTGRRYDYLTEPTKRVLDMLDEYDIKATFFVVADVVEHFFIRAWSNQLLKEGMRLDVMDCIMLVK